VRQATVKISVFPSRVFYSGRECSLKLDWAWESTFFSPQLQNLTILRVGNFFCSSSSYSVYVYLCSFCEDVSGSGNIRFTDIIAGEQCIGKLVPRWGNTLICVTVSYFGGGGGGLERS